MQRRYAIAVPAGASQMSITFTYKGSNGYFWTLDDIVVHGVPSCAANNPCNGGTCVQSVSQTALHGRSLAAHTLLNRPTITSATALGLTMLEHSVTCLGRATALSFFWKRHSISFPCFVLSMKVGGSPLARLAAPSYNPVSR